MDAWSWRPSGSTQATTATPLGCGHANLSDGCVEFDSSEHGVARQKSVPMQELRPEMIRLNVGDRAYRRPS